jgi:hypothetical protein
MGKAGVKFLLLLNIDQVVSDRDMEAASTLQSARDRSQEETENEEAKNGAELREQNAPGPSADRRPARTA